MINSMYNNIGICSVAIWLTLGQVKSLPLSKALLVMPLISHGDLLNYLSHHSSEARSIEELIAKRPLGFTNYNARYYDLLSLSINSIQFLIDIEAAEMLEGNLILLKEIACVAEMGKRANKIAKALPQICNILACSSESLYLNLRVEL